MEHDPRLSEYQVDLEAFRGPLDLLLYLVKRNEVDICDIPIARVLDQFLEFMRLIEWIDVEWAGEFLVMTATLMEIKSKLLLPHSEATAATENEDPRRALVRQLMEYKQFKDTAALLETQAQRQTARLPRLPPEEPRGSSQQPLQPVELWDLVSAFGRLMRETLALQPQQIVVDETPMHVYVETILERLRHEREVAFSSLFTPPHSRGRLLGLFLAVLELIKARQIVAQQPRLFGDIVLYPAPAANTDFSPASLDGQAEPPFIQ
ncbi:MAG: segregation and condensation protein A [Gemmataceae bacterium]